MPLALIGAFALTGWGLFAFMVYRAGKNRPKLKDAIELNAKLMEILREEMKLFNEQIARLKIGPVDADSINDTLKRMRNKEAGK